MIGSLPRTLCVGEREYAIRTDYRDVLKILCAFGDPDLKDAEKVYVCLHNLYIDFPDIPEADYEAAFRAAAGFIDNGAGEQTRKPLRVMDWEQDECILIPAINKVAGREIRAVRYLHWWTFLGYYLEISDSVFSTVLSIRMKKANGKKLEKWEREYWNANRQICALKPRISAEEQAQRARLNAMIDGGYTEEAGDSNGRTDGRDDCGRYRAG